MFLWIRSKDVKSRTTIFNSKLVRENGDYATNSQKYLAWHVFAAQVVNIYWKNGKTKYIKCMLSKWLLNDFILECHGCVYRCRESPLAVLVNKEWSFVTLKYKKAYSTLLTVEMKRLRHWFSHQYLRI